jgi:hypothetical protein
LVQASLLDDEPHDLLDTLTLFRLMKTNGRVWRTRRRSCRRSSPGSSTLIPEQFRDHLERTALLDAMASRATGGEPVSNEDEPP